MRTLRRSGNGMIVGWESVSRGLSLESGSRGEYGIAAGEV